MTSDVDNLVLEHLRALRGELSEVREDVRILQVRMTSLEENTAASELNAARDFLRQADMLVAGVRSLFLNMGDSTAAARLKGIEGRLQDEVQVLERLISEGNAERRASLAYSPAIRAPARAHCFA